MTALIPMLEQELRAAAHRNLTAATAVAPRRRRRLPRPSRGRTLVTVLVASLTLSAGAYAGRGLWLPALGNEQYGHAQPTGEAPPADQLAILGVLRRDQTSADRGPATQAVLRRADRFYGKVRTAYVRRLGTLPGGQVAVLVPVDQPRGFDPDMPDLGGAQVYLGFYDPVTHDVIDPTVPADTHGIEAGFSAVLIGDRRSAAQRAAIDEFLERERAAGRFEQYAGAPVRDQLLSADQMRRLNAATGPRESDPATFVGLVPDGVAKVRIKPGGPTVPMHENFFMARATVGFSPGYTMLDEDGDTVPFAPVTSSRR